MEINSAVNKNNLYIYLSGELDEYSAKTAKSVIDREIDDNLSVHSVVFDFSGASFMDSTGIGVLLGRYKKLKKSGIKSYIQRPSVSINKILQISGIYDIMPKI